ncbi:MAG: hypothetical protein ABSH30_16570 [Acidimicrobiales bacterium]|jgi:hypothetical protein
MFTDEQFTRSLGDAFRAATADLSYDRPAPAPPLVSLATAPRLLVAAAGVGAVIVAATAIPTHVATQGHRTGPTATAASSKAGKFITRRFTLDGYTMTYHQAAGAQQLYGEFVAAVPSDAEPVDAPIAALNGATVTEWVGVDPTTSDNAAYVVFTNGRILEITSSDATQAELVALLMSAQPASIPVAGGTGNQAIRDLGTSG